MYIFTQKLKEKGTVDEYSTPVGNIDFHGGMGK